MTVAFFMTIVLHYNKQILKYAVRHYIKTTYLKRFALLSLLAVIIAISALFDDSPWLQAFTIVPVVAIPTILVLGYYFRVRESLKRLDLLDNGKVVVTAGEPFLTVESAMGKSEMNWHLFTDLWEFSTLYLLFYHNYQFITLPKAQITSEFISFLRTKVVRTV